MGTTRWSTYGCGPGNDLVGFLLWGHARQVIGIDISRKALELARRRLALHRIDGSQGEAGANGRRRR